LNLHSHHVAGLATARGNRRPMMALSCLLPLLLISGCAFLEGTKLAPVAVIEAIPQQGTVPFEVHFSAVASHDLYTSIVTYQWDLGDGSSSSEVIVKHTYSRPGTYVATLTVVNGLGIQNTAKATVIARQAPVPNSPAGLGALAISDRRVDLAWEDRSDNEDGFTVERQGAESGFVEINTVSANVANYTDSADLQPNATYCYRVRAFNRDGVSDYSNQDCVTTASASGSLQDQTDSDENDLVKVTRTVDVQGEEIAVGIVVEAKVALELVAVVEELDEHFTLSEGELTAFQTTLQPGAQLTLSYRATVDDPSGGSLLGTIRAKPADADSQTLELVAQW